MFRGAVLELKALHRMPGPWLPAGLAVWVFLIWLQEPEFLRRSGVPFLWDSLAAALQACLAMLPLAWLLGRSPAAAETVLRATLSPLRANAISTLSIIIYGSEVALVAGLFGGVLDGLGGTWSGGLALQSMAAGLCLLAPLAAVAPGLANLSMSAQGYTVTWLLIAGFYAFWFGAGREATAAGWALLVPALLATVAGLLLSTALVRRRIHI